MASTPGFLPIGNLAPPVPGLPDQADLNPLLTRTHYFDGRLLTAADLTRDQVYLDQRLREMGQVLGRGVARGLEARLSGGRITIAPGVAMNGAGRVLQLAASLTLDLNDRAGIAGLNQGRFVHLPHGLHALVLFYAEAGQGSAEVFPRDLAERTVQYDVTAESVQVGLLPLPLPLPLASPPRVRAALMRWLAEGGGDAGVVPPEAVTLGVVSIRDDRPEWLDAELLRHPLRARVGPGDLQSDLLRAYELLLADILLARRPLTGDFAALEHFQVLPPTGRIPKAAVDPVAGRQGFFPGHFNVSVAPVRQSDLALVQRESLALPAIDLKRDEPVDIVVLAPLSGPDFGRLAATLERQPDPDGSLPAAGGAPNRLLPHLDLLALRLYSVRPVHRLDTDAPAWAALWAAVGESDPVYVRRPTRAAETGISGIRIAVGTPVEPPPLEAPEGGTDALPIDTTPSPADTASLMLDADGVLLERLSVARLASLRAPRNDAGREALANLAETVARDAPATLACVDLLVLVDRRFDPVIWQTLAAIAAETGAEGLRELVGVLEGAEGPAEAALRLAETGPGLGLTDALVSRWGELAEAG